MEPNWDPVVKKFFLKIANSIAWTLLWMITFATAGIYLKLGFINNRPIIFTILFYVSAVMTFLLLFRYLYQTWKNG